MKATLEIDMPESCMLCPITCHGMCFALNKDILDYFDKRRDDCPLKPVISLEEDMKKES